METKRVLIINGGYPAARMANLLGDKEVISHGQRAGKATAIKLYAADIKRINAAKLKRERRVIRNMRNEALQGKEPEGLELLGREWYAERRSCRRNYAIYCMPQEFNPDMSYCGGSEWCCP